MKKAAIVAGVIIFCLMSVVAYSPAQIMPAGKNALSVNAGYSAPLGELSKRFQGTYNVDVGYNRSLSTHFGAEVRFVYGKYDKLSNNPREITYVINDVPTTFTLPPDLDHYFRYTGLSTSLLLNPEVSMGIKPYMLLGLGMYRYEFYRSAFYPYVRLYEPGDPNFEDYHSQTDGTQYAYKMITEWSWGMNGALGFGIPIGANAVFDIKARWEVILADIWPVLFLGLEGVRPIQTLQLTGGIKFIL